MEEIDKNIKGRTEKLKRKIYEVLTTPHRIFVGNIKKSHNNSYTLGDILVTPPFNEGDSHKIYYMGEETTRVDAKEIYNYMGEM